MIQRDKSLVLIPDYLSIRHIRGQGTDFRIIGDPNKVPGELQDDRFLNVSDSEVRRMAMRMVPSVEYASVMTPSFAFYRRFYELRDDCFYADLAARLLASGARVSIYSGLQREKVPQRAQQWFQELGADGVHIIYEEPEEKVGKALDLVTAKEVYALWKTGRKELRTAPGAIVTPGAWDEAKEHDITILIGNGGLR